jgi:multidrug efflux pump subunit AcrA (membrane-fusion protein)
MSANRTIGERLARLASGVESRMKPVTSRLEAGMEASRPLWWSRAIMYAIIGLIVAVIVWACFAQIDQVVPATGRLRPIGTTREVQSPVAGVIAEVLVRQGQAVKKGDVLLRLDKNVTLSKIRAEQEICDALERENAFYRDIMSGKKDPGAPGDLKLPEDVLALVRDRVALEAENRLFAAQAAASDVGISLDPGQKKLFDESQRDREAQIATATKQHEQAKESLAGTKMQLEKAERLLANSKQVVDSYSKIVDSGAVSRVDLLARESDMIEHQKEVENLKSELANYEIEVAKTGEEIQNIQTRLRKQAYDGIEQNHQRMAEIDARLSRVRYENQQRLSDSRGQLAQLQQSLSYHDIVAPVDGVVFDLKHEQGGAVVAEKDPLLQIVPREDLIAEVFVTDEDIGFIKVGLPVRVRIDSFPSREFGDIGGELVFVGSDSLPPTPELPRYTFPCRIRLDRQFMMVRGHAVPLHAGMSVSTQIKVRQRAVISIFLEMFSKPVDQLKEVR